MLRNRFIVILWLFQFFQKQNKKKQKNSKLKKKQILVENQAKMSKFRKFGVFFFLNARNFLHASRRAVIFGKNILRHLPPIFENFDGARAPSVGKNRPFFVKFGFLTFSRQNILTHRPLNIDFRGPSILFSKFRDHFAKIILNMFFCISDIGDVIVSVKRVALFRGTFLTGFMYIYESR